MSMDLLPEQDGRLHFSLGPVEKWVISAFALAVLGLAGWIFTSVNTLLTQQAVTNSKLADIGAQLAGVPELSTRVARLEIQAEQNKQDIKELQRLREIR